MAARGMLPLAADELLEVLVALRGDSEAEIVEAAEATLAEQSQEIFLSAASAESAPPQVLLYLASRTDAGRKVHEAVATHALTPDADAKKVDVKLTDKTVAELDAAASAKEKEILGK